MSPVTKKPVFGSCDKVRLKSACSATETSERLEMSDIETTCIILSRKRTTKALICAFVVRIWQNMFSYDVATKTIWQIKKIKNVIFLFCLFHNIRVWNLMIDGHLHVEYILAKKKKKKKETLLPEFSVYLAFIKKKKKKKTHKNSETWNKLNRKCIFAIFY